MSDKAQFRRGAAAAAEAVKGSPFARTQFFKAEDGKVVYLRFITDAEPDENDEGGWITVLQHQNVKTKAAPEGFKGDWPERMGAVCRRDPAFAGIFDECYICDFLVDGEKLRKPGARVWALAAYREEVLGDGSEALKGPDFKGKRVGWRDVTREVTIPAKEAKDGQPAREEQKVTEKAIVVCNMGYKNFFSVVRGYYDKNGTILDRDFWIKRQGKELDTEYQIIAEDPISVYRLNEKGEKVGDPVVLDLRDPEFQARYHTDTALEDVVMARASDEFYARFFDTRYTSEDGKVTATGAPAEPKPSQDVDEDKIAELASRVRGYKKDGDGAGEADTSEAPAEDEAQPEDKKEPVAASVSGDVDLV